MTEQIRPTPPANWTAMRAAFDRARAARGLSFDALVRHTGLSRSSIIDIAHGRTRGTIDTWYRLAHAVDVPLPDLVAHLYDPPSPGDPVDR